MPNRLLILITMILLCAAPWAGGGTFTLIAMGLLLPCAIALGGAASVHLVLIFFASGLVMHITTPPPGVVIGKTSGIALYLYAALTIRPLRRSMNWLRPGKIGWSALAGVAAVVVVAAIGVIAWTHLAKQDPAVRARILPTSVPPALIPIYMAAFALINAMIEEIIWRGVEMSALEAAFGAGWFALLFQSFHFGVAHYRGGFPNGWSGVLLTFAFGLMMGILRRWTKGLLAPCLAHAAADFTIIWLVAHRVGA